MARPKIVLDGWREQIEQWIKDGLHKEEVQRRLKEQADVNIGLSTLSTQLRAWGIRINRSPIKKSDELRSRVKDLFHSRPNMRDEEMVMLLQQEGFQISGTRALARLRKECGLLKRVEKEQEDKITEDIIKALRKEFGGTFELPDDMGTRDLGIYLRAKYNVVGRDRIRRIASEINPEWVERRKNKGRFGTRPQPVRTKVVAETHTRLEALALRNAPSEGKATFSGNDFVDVPRMPATPDEHYNNSHSETARHTASDSSQVFPNGFGTAPNWLDPSLSEPR